MPEVLDPKPGALWLAHGYPCPQFPGLGAFVRVQAEAIAPNLPSLDIVTPVSAMPFGLGRISPRWRNVADMPALQTQGNITVRRPRYFAHPRENRFGMPHRFMLQAIHRLGLRKPAMIHAHCGVPHGWLAMRLAREWNLPYAITLLGSDVGIFAKVTPGARRRFEQSVRKADAVYAVGRTLADDTEAMTGRRPDVLHYGVNDEWLIAPGDKAAARRRLGLDEDAFICLFVGQLTEAKGAADLGQAIRQIDRTGCARKLQFLFAGDGPVRSELTRMAQCRLSGAVDHEQLLDHYDAADMLILPSYHEGMPTVVLEAGSRGLPVAASDVGSVRTLIDDDLGWLLTPGDVEGLERLILAAADLPAAELSRRGENLRAAVKESFSASGNARRVREAYARVGADLGGSAVNT